MYMLTSTRDRVRSAAQYGRVRTSRTSRESGTRGTSSRGPPAGVGVAERTHLRGLGCLPSPPSPSPCAQGEGNGDGERAKTGIPPPVSRRAGRGGTVVVRARKL